MNEAKSDRTRGWNPFRALGPGLVVAAAGIGAGDVVTATVVGAEYGTQLIWAILACVVLKFVLTEGLARWQLATNTTVVEACASRLPRWGAVYFVTYLFLWTFFVGASLSSACGLAGHAIFPQFPVWTWGIIHSIMAAAIVFFGHFAVFEYVMKALVGVMVLTVLSCAVMVGPDVGSLIFDLVRPRVPPGGGKSVLGILGGIAGSMTMLCYGFWIRENRWHGLERGKSVQIDLLIAYGVTFIFAVALTIVAAGCDAVATQGNGMAVEVATRLQERIGPVGRWVFLLGFWCAVFTSMLGVWQGVPYLFAEFVSTGNARRGSTEIDLKKTLAYRGYLLYLAGPPLLLLFADKPVGVVFLFTIIGAFFMPFLATVLLYLNNRADWTGKFRNGPLRNAALWVSLGLFGWMAIGEIVDAVSTLVR